MCVCVCVCVRVCEPFFEEGTQAPVIDNSTDNPFTREREHFIEEGIRAPVTDASCGVQLFFKQ